jgi:hypothetical protein
MQFQILDKQEVTKLLAKDKRIMALQMTTMKHEARGLWFQDWDVDETWGGGGRVGAGFRIRGTGSSRVIFQNQLSKKQFSRK